jgi:hypothetical protein
MPINRTPPPALANIQVSSSDFPRTLVVAFVEGALVLKLQMLFEPGSYKLAYVCFSDFAEGSAFPHSRNCIPQTCGLPQLSAQPDRARHMVRDPARTITLTIGGFPKTSLGAPLQPIDSAA